jgi:hypothetical protein
MVYQLLSRISRSTLNRTRSVHTHSEGIAECDLGTKVRPLGSPWSLQLKDKGPFDVRAPMTPGKLDALNHLGNAGAHDRQSLGRHVPCASVFAHRKMGIHPSFQLRSFFKLVFVARTELRYALSHGTLDGPLGAKPSLGFDGDAFFRRWVSHRVRSALGSGGICSTCPKKDGEG